MERGKVWWLGKYVIVTWNEHGHAEQALKAYNYLLEWARTVC